MTGDLAATLQRSDGELEALQTALRRIEATLSVERTRAAAIRETARQEAQTAQTLSQKFNDEKMKRKELRKELAAAAEHLKVAVDKNCRLTAALAASQEEQGRLRAAQGSKEAELAKCKEQLLQLQTELALCKEELESATIASNSKSTIIDRLQDQLSTAKAHAATQTASLASAAAAQRRLQCQLVDMEKKRDVALLSLTEDNESLRKRLDNARSEVALAKDDASREVAQANDESVLLKSQQKVLHDCLEAARTEAARNASTIAELRRQVAILKKECCKAQDAAAEARAETSHSMMAVQRAHRAFEILHAKFEHVQAREAAAAVDCDRQRAALAAVGKGFEEIAEKLALAEGRLQQERQSHKGTRAELETVRNECKVARQGKLSPASRGWK